MREGLSALVVLATAACGAHAGADRSSDDAGGTVLVPIDASFPSTPDASKPHHIAVDAADAGDAGTDADAAPVGFITGVLDFDAGPCGGHNAGALPGIVEGPPMGGGLYAGGYDVVSLGQGGTIVVSFAPDTIVDGPGIDFIVFENTFDVDGSMGRERDAEPGEVSVSDDGKTWTPFPCTDTTSAEPPAGWSSSHCAGLNPVISTPGGVSPMDVDAAGGDPFDLAWIGVNSAKYVRIRSVVVESCPDGGDPGGPGTGGFDLDAIAIIHGSLP